MRTRMWVRQQIREVERGRLVERGQDRSLPFFRALGSSPGLLELQRPLCDSILMQHVLRARGKQDERVGVFLDGVAAAR